MTIGKLLHNKETNAAAALALSGTLIVLVAKGLGPVTSKSMVSRVLSNPVPRLEPIVARDTGVSSQPTHLRTAA